MPDPDLDELISRLERAAEQLRAADLAPDHAALLVDECAQLAAEAGAELDRRVRAGDVAAAPAPGPGQLALGS